MVVCPSLKTMKLGERDHRIYVETDEIGFSSKVNGQGKERITYIV